LPDSTPEIALSVSFDIRTEGDEGHEIIRVAAPVIVDGALSLRHWDCPIAFTGEGRLHLHIEDALALAMMTMEAAFLANSAMVNTTNEERIAALQGEVKRVK
jgi:hypothetical protein